MTFRAALASLVALVVPFVARSAFAAACTLGEHAGIDEIEAKTAKSVVCHELQLRAPNGVFDVRFGRLNGRTLVTVTEGLDESHQVTTFVSGLDEIAIAAPRLADSLVESKPLVETRNVDNVLAEEGRMPKKVATVVGATLGTYAMSSVGAPSAPSGGIDVGLAFRTGSLGLAGNGRLGGIGSGAKKLSNVSLDVGARLYLTNGELSPFVGGGVGLAKLTRHGNEGREESGGGAGAYAMLGIEAMRASHVGLMVLARVDLPFYSLDPEKEESAAYYAPSRSAPDPTRPSIYVAPISLMVALSFH